MLCYCRWIHTQVGSVNLYDARKGQSWNLSWGMCHWLLVAMACIGNPDIIILWEVPHLQCQADKKTMLSVITVEELHDLLLPLCHTTDPEKLLALNTTNTVNRAIFLYK